MAYLKKSPKNQQKHFDRIIKRRKQIDWPARAHQLEYDYGFIEESFCCRNKTTGITERYFIAGDTIAFALYVDGQAREPKTEYDNSLVWYSKNVGIRTTLHYLLGLHSGFVPIQALAYPRMQIWEHGCVVDRNEKQRFTRSKIRELKTTYHIQTMIDKVHHRVLVSIQLAPKKPEFETRGYNPVWDW